LNPGDRVVVGADLEDRRLTFDAVEAPAGAAKTPDENR
jgi:hypothetical protein